MKAYEIYGKSQGRMIEMEIPEPKDNEVIVQVKASGLCGTDVHIYEGNYYGEFPVIGGHEFSGVVAKVGKNVKTFQPGDRVAADPNVFCEACEFCQQNIQNYCLDAKAIGIEINGAFGEYLAAPASSVFKLEGDKSFEEYAFAEPLSCVINGQNRARPEIGGNVLVIGCGAIGLLHIQLARYNGAGKIVAVDIDEKREDVALKMGASAFLKSDENLAENAFEISKYGYSLVIDCTGVPKVIENAVQLVRSDGTLLIFGVCNNDAQITVNPYEIFQRDLTITGSFSLRKTYKAAISMIEDGCINVKDLIGERISLEQLEDSIQRMGRGETSLKTMIVY